MDVINILCLLNTFSLSLSEMFSGFALPLCVFDKIKLTMPIKFHNINKEEKERKD